MASNFSAYLLSSGACPMGCGVICSVKLCGNCSTAFMSKIAVGLTVWRIYYYWLCIYEMSLPFVLVIGVTKANYFEKQSLEIVLV